MQSDSVPVLNVWRSQCCCFVSGWVWIRWLGICQGHWSPTGCCSAGAGTPGGPLMQCNESVAWRERTFSAGCVSWQSTRYCGDQPEVQWEINNIEILNNIYTRTHAMKIGSFPVKGQNIYLAHLNILHAVNFCTLSGKYFHSCIKLNRRYTYFYLLVFGFYLPYANSLCVI